jgi:hypothetical protein
MQIEWLLLGVAPDTVQRFVLPEAFGERRPIVRRIRFRTDESNAPLGIDLTNSTGSGITSHPAADNQIVIMFHKSSLSRRSPEQDSTWIQEMTNFQRSKLQISAVFRVLPGGGNQGLIRAMASRSDIRTSAERAIMHGAVMLLVAAVAVLGGCSGSAVKGNGVITTENRPISDFAELEAAGAYKIKWSSGKPGLTITTDSNLLALIKTSVNGNTLQIDSQNLKPTQGIVIHVSSGSLKDVRLNGAVSLTASNVSGGDLKVESNGASFVSVDGSVTKLEANFSGASRLDAKSLRAQTAEVSLSGACLADVTVGETLNATISGAGILTYSGNPKSVEKNVSGAGRIQARP